MNATKKQLLEWIDQDREVLIAFLQGFLRCKTPNPPGNTVAGANFVSAFLEKQKLPFKRIAPNPEMPNIVATTELAKPGRHLVLNGHMDVFPEGPPNEWTRDPWGGELVDGRIYGRGACDMKCGTTASLFTYAYLNRIKDQLKGRLTLTAVSDEETFGPWGTRYLMEHHRDEVLGDCCLNGEPSSPYTIRFGEKGPLWLMFKVATRGGHGAYVHVSRNAIAIAVAIMSDLQELAQLAVSEPPELTAALDAAHDGMERAYGKGASNTVRKVTVNLGRISGGVKVNMIASACEFEVDVRAPVGLTHQALIARIDEIVARYPEASYTVQGGSEPNWCAPDADMFGYVRDNAQSISDMNPVTVVSPGGTDTRLWRMRGVTAVVYGPSPKGMGSADEYVTVDEFMHVVKTHVLSAYDYMTAA
jgi:succinyl-diaminopimelate desuccinylase